MSETCIRVQADENQIKSCRQAIGELNQHFLDASLKMGAVGYPTRMKILFLLREEGRMCPCDLSDILGMSVPAISQHLKKMKSLDLVFATREAQTLYYSIHEKEKLFVNEVLSLVAKSTPTL